MSFKVKPLAGKESAVETETARDAATAVEQAWQQGNGPIKVEIEDERASVDEETESERDMKRRGNEGK
ncbi:hypothetical protein ACQKKX_02010 [Neorhizobium sp. NPDC001467]|uniref:hypothetical protein n=1 Tax=Neorhizobium sp. NPDC001467 TaxID=3390595 RepID=UPI003D07D8EB